MWSLDMESRVLRLAIERGLVDPKILAACSSGHGGSGAGALRAFGLHQVPQEVGWTEGELQQLLWDAVNGSFMGSSSPSPWLEEQTEPSFPGGRFDSPVLIGQGATAWVYAVFDSRLRRKVALKRLKPSLHFGAGKILGEAKLQARIDHPFVCKVYEVLDSEGEAFIVMQLAEADTLLAHAGTLTVAEVVAMVRDAALGAHAAHEAGLLHLDLKPGNILVRRDDAGQLRPLLSDFGMGREEGAHGDATPMGTPPFSAPEQMPGSATPADRRTDVYALGVVLYVLLTRRFPFNADSFPALLEAIRTAPPIPLRDLNRRLPRELDAVISRCLAKGLSDRYPSAKHLAQDLDRFLVSRPLEAVGSTLSYRGRKALSRHPWVAWALLICLAAIGTVVTINVQRQRQIDRLFAVLRVVEDRYQEEFHKLERRMEAATTEADREAIRKEMAARREARDAELAGLRRQIERLSKNAASHNTSPPDPTAAAPYAQPSLPMATTTPPSPAASGRVTVTEVPLQVPAKANDSTRDHQKITLPSDAPFVESLKVPMTAREERTGIDRSPDQELAPRGDLATPSTASLRPGLASSDPSESGGTPQGSGPVTRFRQKVIPELSRDQLDTFAGEVITMKVQLDPFGNARTVRTDACPPALEPLFRKAAKDTKFIPTGPNYRGGWVVISYRITPQGVKH